MKAVLEAVSATGYGRLLAVLRPWDINMSHMEWTGPAAKLSTAQLTYCFRIVHQYYLHNVKTDRVTFDVFNYNCAEDKAGLALFPAGSECKSYYAFRNALTSVYFDGRGLSQQARRLKNSRTTTIN